MRIWITNAKSLTGRSAAMGIAAAVLLGATLAVVNGIWKNWPGKAPDGRLVPAPLDLPVAPSPGYRSPELPVSRRGVGNGDEIQGKAIVVCFVSASSGPSLAQLPALGRAATDLPDVLVVMVAVGDDQESLDSWLKAGQVPEEIAARAVADKGGSEARRWLVTAAPTTFVIAADGVVDGLRVGVMSYSELEQAIKHAHDSAANRRRT